MNITQASIVNNRTAWVLFLVLLLAGYQAYTKLPRAYDPGFIIRAAQVITYLPGASPDRVEALVSNQIEKVIQEIPELDFVTSTSKTGVSIVVANIKENYTDMRPIWDNLRRKVESVRGDLPDGVVGPIVNDEFGDVFGVVLSLTGEGFSNAELQTIAENAKDELLNLSDAAKVELYGVQDERIFVEYNNARLTELGVSPSQLSQMISSRNIIVSGGSIVLGKERIELEPSGNFESIEDIENTILTLPETQRVLYLKDIAKVYWGYVDPPSQLVKADLQPAIGIGISMREGGNNIRLGEEVRELVDQFHQTYPIGIDFTEVNFSPQEVDDKVNDFVANLVQAITVVAAVMLFSLGLRTGLVVATLIPASMLAAMLVMSTFEIGLDQISLAALIIALGMLVDNGIVMSESIMVQMNDGKSPVQAAIDSAGELRVPLLTSSLTTAAAFLPIYLAESAIGEFTASLFKVVAITLLCSWILSMTIIPMLCVYFLKSKQVEKKEPSIIFRAYSRLLKFSLHNRFVVVGVVIALFWLAMVGMSYVPKIFFPPSDRLYFKTELELPIGTDIRTTEQVAQEFGQFIDEQLSIGPDREDGVTNWINYIGAGGTRFVLSHTPESSSPNYALFVINVTDFRIIDGLMEQLEDYAFENYPDLKITTKKIENGTPVKNPVEVRLYGKNTDRLFEKVDALKQQMSSMPELRNISDNWGQRTKKFNVVINQTKARRAGISSEDIAVSLQSGLSGMELTEFRRGEDIIPVVLRSVAADRQDLGKLEALSVYVQSTGESIPLRQVADIEVVWENAKILRRDRFKTVTVGAQLVGDVTAREAVAKLTPWLDEQAAKWEVGARYELGGELESSGKANQSIAEQLPVAAFIILILLVGQFNSIRKPAIILVTIPMGFIGISFGLLAANSFFGFMTLLGLISLAGIVINNAIVLLERIQLEIDVNGLSPQEAIIEAAQRRFRPILLTTATTVLGMLPLYLGGGEMWEPMAVAIIGGLLFSTLLTLCVVPVLYSLLYRVEYAKGQ
ncbi:MAG: AcrB/AcrD/AcrF family protein [Oleiphilus sp.]|nr:MAG: AcrB/AcrD/AcrF family protein [Oleiphilus sp.]